MCPLIFSDRVMLEDLVYRVVLEKRDKKYFSKLLITSTCKHYYSLG